MIRHISQNLLEECESSITLETVNFPADSDLLRAFVHSLSTDKVGFAVQFSPTFHVEALAFASIQKVLLVKILSIPTGSTQVAIKRLRGLDELLDNPKIHLAAFEMPRLAFSIYRTISRNLSGIDLSTIDPFLGTRPSPPPQVTDRVFTFVNSDMVDLIFSAMTPQGQEDRFVALRAWLSFRVAERYNLDGQFRVNTARLSSKELDCLGRLQLEIDLLRAAQPEVANNDFINVGQEGEDTVIVNARYKTRVRESRQTSVVFFGADGEQLGQGRAVSMNGRQTLVKTSTGRQLPLKGVEQIKVVGRQDLTNAEKARQEFFLFLLQGRATLSSPHVQLLWFPTEEDKAHLKSMRNTKGHAVTSTMNPSQAAVVDAMSRQNLIVVHGPPGTGKTRTISAAVRHWSSQEPPAHSWLVAQSNVGVRNIAETLLRQGITTFKIVVSKEFYVEWHEHLYEEMQHHLVRTDEMPKEVFETGMVFHDTTTILCTLSTLSNPALDTAGVFKLKPVTNLVVDEASQISMADYMHLLQKFKDLESLSFFGDPKQLPPYGQEQVAELQSIFQVKHVKPAAYFLDTQYRMPEVIGNFLSREMYNNKLKSQHLIKDYSCLAFVDESRGMEQQDGTSWKNTREVHTCVNLVKNYYKHKNFCIITPYDAQRAAIEKALQVENLPWETVFNVDSFQGNEAPFVIISLVRTAKPGFLFSKNRVNVMLSRCKEGMIIVSNRTFLRSEQAQDTLVGKLSAAVPRHESVWVSWGDVAERRVDLPGVPGRGHPQGAPSNSPIGSVVVASTSPSHQASGFRTRPFGLPTPGPTSTESSRSGTPTCPLGQQPNRALRGANSELSQNVQVPRSPSWANVAVRNQPRASGPVPQAGRRKKRKQLVLLDVV